MTSNTLQELEQLEQTLHTHLVQKQAYQAQLAEAESAQQEMGDVAYRIIGNLMVKTSPATLKDELETKQLTLKKRIVALETQEKKLREDMQKLQQEALGDSHDNV